jgi:hypothetical protein
VPPVAAVVDPAALPFPLGILGSMATALAEAVAQTRMARNFMIILLHGGNEK